MKISAAGTQTEVSPLSSGWNDPRDLEFDVSDPNSLWVADTSDSQIVKMSRTGTILAQFPATPGVGAFQTPYGLANDAVRRLRGRHLQQPRPEDLEDRRIGPVEPDQLQPHVEPHVLASA